jgi:integrase
MVKSRDGRWVVEFQCRGIRIHRRCPPGSTRADAVELETRIRREIFDQRDLGRCPVVPLPAAVELWLRERSTGRKSERETRNHARALVDAIDGKTLADLVAVADAYRRRKLAAATVNRRLAVLKAVAKFAHRKGWTPSNLSSLIPMLPEHNARHVYLTPPQVAALLEALEPEPEVQAFVAMAVYTGMRRGELLALRKNQIAASAIDLGRTPRPAPAARSDHPAGASVPAIRAIPQEPHVVLCPPLS